MKRSFWITLLLLCGLVQTTTQAQTLDVVYPGATWEQADPQALGWSTQKLDDARQYWGTLAQGSVIVVDNGRVVAEWGDPAKRIKMSSVRKSFLSALYGIYVRHGRLDLSKTLAQFGIDDDPPLTPAEKTATLRMVLQSRSGVYHPYVGGTPAERAAMPARGSHAPGTFWYYNNWDFNVLGTIFEQQLKTKIAVEFRDRISTPIQMQDFRLEDMYYFGSTSETAKVEQSLHPAYHFRMSARDMARFGYLFLRQGKWKGAEVVPYAWVAESTTPYSDVGSGGGYGYLWWVNGWPGVSEKSYSARGALGKFIVVIPERDLVVVYQNHTEFPDDAAAMPESEVNKLPRVSGAQMGKLLKLILDAQQQTSKRSPSR
jgi:CubicO group peptidase (beta-lactamase class C family)